MLSLVKNKRCIYSTDSVDSLISYIKNHMDSDEIKQAEEMWKTENRTEYGAMLHLCLLDNCTELEGVSLLIHKGKI